MPAKGQTFDRGRVRAVRDTFAEAARNGTTLRAVAAEVGVSVPTARAAARRYRVRFGRGPAPDVLYRAAVMNHVANGADTGREVARRMGRHCDWVQRVVRELVLRGLIRKTGYGRGTRLEASESWRVDEKTRRDSPAGGEDGRG